EQRQIQWMFGQLDQFDCIDVRPVSLRETIRLLDDVSAARGSLGFVVVTVRSPPGPTPSAIVRYAVVSASEQPRPGRSMYQPSVSLVLGGALAPGLGSTVTVVRTRRAT